MIIVVEGVNDMKAVRRAINADVYVLGTATRAEDPFLIRELQSLLKKYAGILLFLDPDVAGRQARNSISTAIEGCWHAFIPTPLAIATEAVRTKEAGNIGLEHASPRAIQRAILGRRQATPGRTEFSREELQQMGLVAAALHERGGNVTARRLLVCDFLGLGACDGKQLLRQLNSYGFTKEDLVQALAWAERQLDDDGGGSNSSSVAAA